MSAPWPRLLQRLVAPRYDPRSGGLSPSKLPPFALVVQRCYASSVIAPRNGEGGVTATSEAERGSDSSRTVNRGGGAASARIVDLNVTYFSNIDIHILKYKSFKKAEGGKIEPPPPPTSSVPALHGGNKNVIPQKGSEVNLTLGGIDLNSSGSVVVKEDKKLITVLFTDGRDGRAFTLKAETMEDLHGWKVALEEAISNAPNPALVMGQNGIRNDQSNGDDVSSEQLKDRQIVKSLVIGGPILLALEDIDGTPSFLEKALRFLEEYGVKIEGILRQAADVDDVEHRIHEYEKGKIDFLPEEDPHVIADCIKYVLRELPSSPVPASCCKALLEAFRTERGIRVSAMRSAICETFPEPNRRLLQRILMMMQTVASHKAENRMSISAVAACMAPLLLRPLLAGDCELEEDFSVGGDNSVQLLQAAAAANHAQAIVIILLEEYDNIFGDGAVSHEPYTDSEESGSESDEITDDDYDDEDDDSFDDDGDDYTTEASGTDLDEHEPSPISSESAEIQHHKKVSERQIRQLDDVVEARKNLPSSPPQTSLLQHDNVPNSDGKMESNELLGADPAGNSSELSHEPVRSTRRPTVWGRTPGRKNLSMESVELPLENVVEIQKLESIKTDSETQISTEAKANLLLQDSLERRKHDLHELRLGLEKDVARLHEQLQKQTESRTTLELGLKISQLPPSVSSFVDEKMKAELEEIAQAEAYVINLNQKADDLELHLNQQREQNSRIRHEICNQLHQIQNHQLNSKEKQTDGGFLPISCTSENLPRSKHESNLEKPYNYIHKKQETSSSLTMSLPLNQQTDVVQNRKAGAEIDTNKLATTSSRKSSTRIEGSNSTTSALSKLTNRLTFLKERRTQIATELQNLDSKGQSSENGQLLQSVDKGLISEGHPNLDRGKSESFPTVDKGHSKVPPRTYSR
ncbi:hypothetical protein BUALT_Bualt15G0125100 [Buddleja alternifolia]|uniref:Rho-GAP domain-containing protein n=1 Tax=Buddleja alternifolia TaxID=168488 RepID=A0AAV6WLG7_9LAMI|nr:hypothetical protein BUALT_Bualt15G0125100 [Buddleja alternifolia]